MKLGALALLLFLPALTAFAQETSPPLTERWARVGVPRKPLPDAKNSLLAVTARCEQFSKKFQRELQAKGLNTVKQFRSSNYSAKALAEALALEIDLKNLISKGTGQFPSSLEDPSVWKIFMASSALSANAANAFQKEQPRQCLNHLSFNFQFAQYLYNCEPSYVHYTMTTAIWRRTAVNLLTLYADTENAKTRTAIEALWSKHRGRPQNLISAVKGEAFFSYAILEDLPNWIKEQETNGTYSLLSVYQPPLRDCTLQQIEEMDYDAELSLHKELEETEALLLWIKSDNPLTENKVHPPKANEPRELAFYLTTPNGLRLIMDDCTLVPGWTPLLATRAPDVILNTSFAWLQAEAEGRTISSLNDLVPDYLESLPIDPADGKPLRCIAEKRLLYSVGTDFLDNKGIAEHGQAPYWSLTEPAFTIPKTQ